MQNQYDYIITGAGLAGSSLLIRIMNDPFFQKKKILIIDESEKKLNDRTWCFWEKESGPFEGIVHHHWNTLHFVSDSFSRDMNIDPYTYKMIRGIDLYQYIQKESKKFPNIEWRFGRVKSIGQKNGQAIVETEVTYFTANYVFNSIQFKPIQISADEKGNGKILLLQHFKGWVIETSEPKFNPNAATFMDFSIDQKKGTAFMYCLPTSVSTALLEYTLFTENLLAPEEYEQALQKYIKENLGIDEYTIKHEEFGIIPMTNLHFPLQDGRIVHLGVAGGQVKGSSGYAFKSIQKRADEIIRQLKSAGTVDLRNFLAGNKFHFYDSVLLHVLNGNKLKGSRIFSDIFHKNKVETIFRFLDNESNLLEDLQIMNSVPTKVFLPVALRELIR